MPPDDPPPLVVDAEPALDDGEDRRPYPAPKGSDAPLDVAWLWMMDDLMGCTWRRP